VPGAIGEDIINPRGEKMTNSQNTFRYPRRHTKSEYRAAGIEVIDPRQGRYRFIWWERKIAIFGCITCGQSWLVDYPPRGRRLERGIIGQFHKVSIKYLPRYVDEFCYRFNNRSNKHIFEDTLARGLGVTNV